MINVRDKRKLFYWFFSVLTGWLKKLKTRNTYLVLRLIKHIGSCNDINSHLVGSCACFSLDLDVKKTISSKKYLNKYFIGCIHSYVPFKRVKRFPLTLRQVRKTYKSNRPCWSVVFIFGERINYEHIYLLAAVVRVCRFTHFYDLCVKLYLFVV